MRDFQKPGRSPAYGEHGMAATSHPLATLTALDVLRAGGNAVDAALAASAMLCVVEPHMTGVGGDCFALYAPAGGTADGPVVALNGSGMAPAAATVEALRGLGVETIGPESPHAVTVPGAVDAWCRLQQDFGTRGLDELFAPAIRRAEEGYAVHPRVTFDWAKQYQRVCGDANARAVFGLDGRPPSPGDRHSQPALAGTLRAIAAHGRAGFYEGAVAEDIVDTLRGLGGLHTLDDFAAQRADYVAPIRTAYRDHEVYECPPNGQGLAALLILNILRGVPGFATLPQADRIHWLAEASKLAYHLRDTRFCDPRHGTVDVEGLLSEAMADRLRAAIDPQRAGPGIPPDGPEHRHTVYLCVVDRDGNAISFINSIFDLFGSTRMAPRSGVMLQNRGQSFRMDPAHPNAIAPRKRPLHTIIPGMLVKDGRAVMPFGVMGGQYQAVGHADLITGILDLGLDPQAVMERPRSFAHAGLLKMEATHDDAVADDLRRRGHAVEITDDPLGGSQAIRIDHARGVLIGGSDPRKDGCAMGY